jgi:hypothetical protein
MTINILAECGHVNQQVAPLNWHRLNSVAVQRQSSRCSQAHVEAYTARESQDSACNRHYMEIMISFRLWPPLSQWRTHRSTLRTRPANSTALLDLGVNRNKKPYPYRESEPGRTTSSKSGIETCTEEVPGPYIARPARTEYIIHDWGVSRLRFRNRTSSMTPLLE